MGQTTLTRALCVIDEVSRHNDGMRFSEVRAFLENPSPTTVSKILRELTAMDVLTKNAHGAYILGIKPYFWGKAAATRQGMMQQIQKQMKILHCEFNASVNLLTCANASVFCLESFMAPQSPSMWQGGQSLDLELPVIGSIFFYTREQLRDEAFLLSEIKKHNEKLSLEQVKKMIRSAADSDVQDDSALFYPGARRFAVPIREKGKTVMVLGLGVLDAAVSSKDVREKIFLRMRQLKKNIENDITGVAGP